jgi:hypothetical protein
VIDETLTEKQHSALEAVAWGTEHFGALVSGRSHHRRTLVALATKGLVRLTSQVAVCDGDGFLLQPERYRDGWTLTEKGKALLRQFKEENEAAA